MALVAWYPLNEDLRNNGDSSFDLTSRYGIGYVSGKLGKSAAINYNPLQANNSPFKNTTTYSICGWIYLDLLGLTQTIICSRTTIGYGLALFVLTSNKIRIDASIDKTSFQWTTDYVFEAGKWTHFTVTNDNGKLSYYINGELKQTHIITSTTQYIGDYMTIGASSESNTVLGNDNFFKGRMNDLRIYDHALSQSEIQEIYRSLILKYSFDTPIEDQNIGTAVVTNVTPNLNGQDNQCPIIGKILYNKDYFVENNYFTISFDLTIEDIGAVEGLESSGSMGLQEFSYIGGTQKWNTMIKSDNELYGRNSRIGKIFEPTSNDIDLAKNGTYHFSRTYKLVNASQYTSDFNFQIRCNYLLAGVASVSNFKVVLGKKEILSDGTDEILYDESGFGHNAKVIGSTNFLPALYYSTESKIGEGCYQSMTKTSSGDDTYGIIQTLNTFDEIPEISIAFWLYVPETDNNTGDNTILGYSTNAENYGIWIRRNDVFLTFTLYHTSLPPIELQRNEWQYIVITAQKQGDFKVYLNGELKSSKSNVGGTDWEDAYLTIGDLRYGRGLDLDGKIDDLKIYATILDEEYIKKEYKERTKIDNNGNIYCNELIEINDDNNIFSFNNITNYRELPNIEESFFDKNSLLIASTEGEEDARYFRVRMKFSAGTYKVFRIYNVIGDNYTNTTGRFHISKIDWSKQFIDIRPNSYYGTMTFTEDTDIYMTFLASEKDSNTDKIIVQYSLYIYPDENQEIQETKILGNGQVEGYNLKEKDEKLTKIYNKQRTIQTETLYEY